MSRYQTEDRIVFTRAQRAEILAKSSSRCAKCGEPLTTSTMTVEHIIPLSKGGTNDISNLVALCYDCNQSKSNYILHPADYYGYVKKEYMQEIEAAFQKYLKDVPWYGRRNYTKEDKKLFYYDCKPGHVIATKSHYKVRMFRQALTLERVYADDTDEIYNFVKEYDDKYGLDVSILRDCLNDVFDKGCIYKLCHGDSIIAVFPFSVYAFTDASDETHYKLKINGIPNKYPKPQYANAICDVITYVMGCLSELNYMSAMMCVPVIPENDLYLGAIMRSFDAPIITSDHGWNYHLISIIAPSAESEEDCHFIYKQMAQTDFDTAQNIISDGLERRLNLPSLHKLAEKKERVETHKKNIIHPKAHNTKKPKRDYDEYTDIEYYKHS